VYDGGDGIEDPLGAARRHRHLGVGIVGRAVQRSELSRDRLAQGRDALHRRVLVASVAHVTGDGLDQRGIAVEVRKTLREIDRAGVGGEL